MNFSSIAPICTSGIELFLRFCGFFRAIQTIFRCWVWVISTIKIWENQPEHKLMLKERKTLRAWTSSEPYPQKKKHGHFSVRHIMHWARLWGTAVRNQTWEWSVPWNTALRRARGLETEGKMQGGRKVSRGRWAGCGSFQRKPGGPHKEGKLKVSIFQMFILFQEKGFKQQRLRAWGTFYVRNDFSVQVRKKCRILILKKANSGDQRQRVHDESHPVLPDPLSWVEAEIMSVDFEGIWFWQTLNTGGGRCAREERVHLVPGHRSPSHHQRRRTLLAWSVGRQPQALGCVQKRGGKKH